MPSVAEARPPYVVFELRPTEDREATLANGYFTAKDVPYAIITPQGSKDRIERVASEWFEQLEQQANDGRLPREWLSAFRGVYKDWLNGNEPALSGTDVRNWPAISPAQVLSLREARLMTVEDLANANEESIGRLGMGGRALKARAQEWLASAGDTGKQAEAIAALKVKNEDLQTRNTELTEALERLGKRLELLENPSKGGATSQKL